MILVAGVTLQDQVSMELLYWRAEYAELGVSAWQGIAMRSALMVVATITALGFLALVPSTGSWFTRLGPATLVVYLYHGFVVNRVHPGVRLGRRRGLPRPAGRDHRRRAAVAAARRAARGEGAEHRGRPARRVERNVNPLDWPDETLSGREEPRPGGPQWPGVIR